MSPDMFNLSAMTESWQAQLTIGTIRMSLCVEGQAIRYRRADGGTHIGGALAALWASPGW